MNLRVGIDIGSTTVKVVVLNEQNELLFRSYERHYSKTRERAVQTLRSISDLLTGQTIHMTITGSAGVRPAASTLSRRSMPPLPPSIHMSPTLTPSLSWGARMPRSFSLAGPLRSE